MATTGSDVAASSTVDAKRESKHASSLVWLVPILILAAAVRILGLGNTNLWGDEAFSVMMSLGPISHIPSVLATVEPHPPLYPFLLAGWLRLFGHSEYIARLPSAFAGIASVAVASSLARSFVPAKDERGSTVAAVFAALLVALNPFQVWYSQEARMYAQVSFFAGLATLALVRLWYGRRGGTLLYALAVVGAAGSHYYGLFVPLAHGLTVIVNARRDPKAFVRWVRAAVLAGILYLPWVIFALHIFTSYYGARPGSVHLLPLLASSWVRVAAGWSLSWPHAVAAATVITILAIVGLVLPARCESDRFLRWALPFWVVTPYVVGLGLSLFRPMFAERYLIVSSLPLILLVARAAVGLVLGARQRSGKLGLGRPSFVHPCTVMGGFVIVAALGVAAPALYNVWIGRYLKSAYNTHMREVDALSLPGDAVILDGVSQTPLYLYYQKKQMPMYPLPANVPLKPRATTAALEKIASKYRGVWIFLYAVPDYDPTYFIPRWLTANAYRGFDQWAVNGRLQYYRFAPDSALTRHDTAISFGQSLRLNGYATSTTPVAAGATLPVDLHWQRLATPLKKPRATLRLVDSTGFTWAQTDQSIGGGFLAENSWPSGAALDDRHGLMVPLGTPPGDYQLLLNVYSADHPQPLNIAGSGAPIVPGGLVLGTVRVDQPSTTIWSAGIGGYHATNASFAGQISLLGSAGSESATAGESGYLTLVWRALSAHPNVSQVRLALIGQDNKVAEQKVVPLATATYPTVQWPSGAVLREQYHLPISDRLPAGTYRLTVRPEVPGVAESVSLGNIRIRAGAPIPPAATPEHPLNYSLGGVIALDGVDLPTSPVHPGQTVNLTLHWRDLSSPNDDYTVFVHVLDASQKIVAQHDQPPDGGKRPTSSWFPGDVILDHYQLVLPSSVQPGNYSIEVGMYLPSNGKRLPVSVGGQPKGNRIIVGQLQVVR